jgi:hypothetical protein
MYSVMGQWGTHYKHHNGKLIIKVTYREKQERKRERERERERKKRGRERERERERR